MVWMKKSFVITGLLAVIISMSLFSCVPTDTRQPKPVAGKGSPLAAETRKMVADISKNHGLEGIPVQISANHFWEKTTRNNLPFSAELSDALAAELSRAGAVVTLQETGEQPLKMTGSYAKAGDRLTITVQLRQMGDTASRDLAVVRGTIPVQSLDPAWLAPRFDRIARTLVRMLESEYSGMRSLKIATRPFIQGARSGPSLTLGREMEKYMAQALASSYTFQAAGTATDQAEAILTGEYTRMGDTMMFHAGIQDLQTGRIHAGATFATPMPHIPKELLLPDIQSLDAAVQALAAHLLETYTAVTKPSNNLETVFVNRHSFHDDIQAAIVPMSALLAEKFKQILSTCRVLTVTENPALPATLMLSGKIVEERDGLLMSAGLDRVTAKDTGLTVSHIATHQVRLGRPYCDPAWLTPTLPGKTGFLMKDLETKSRSSLPGDQRPDITITRFKFKNTRLFSEFSDQLHHQILAYFSGSRFYQPVKNPEAKMAEHKQQGTRAIVPTKKSEATQAAMEDARYYVEGSFWPGNRGELEINATLASVDGRVLASSAITVPGHLIDLDRVTPVQDITFQQDLQAVSDPGDHGLAVELMTQKGRNNVSFARGEEITFFVKANQDVYVNIFTADVDNQIYRIYPNAFSPPNPKISAGRVTAIPDNTYAADFAFQVQGKTGNEMVFAVASDQPLPDIPGSTDTGFYGMRQMGNDIQQIKAFLSEYAGRRGMYLSWDAVAIVTK
jgi:hypothetical protein